MKESLRISDERIGEMRLSPEEMAALAGRVFLVSYGSENRRRRGKAFDLRMFYERWARSADAGNAFLPTHLGIRAADEFEAKIPWDQLEDAALIFADEDGEELEPSHGGPVRVTVPNGSSDCLNVKRVVALRYLHDTHDTEAVYGFRNEIPMDDLRKRFSDK